MPSLLLTCPVGLEDLVRGDVQQATRLQVSVHAAGELLALDVSPEQLATLREQPMIDRMAVPGTDEAARRAAAVLLDTEPRFRVHLPGDTAARQQLVEQVSRQTGWTNSANDWQLNIDTVADRIEVGPLAWAARFGRLQRLPATTPPVVAAGVLRLAKVSGADRLLDPCAGVGTMPIVDALTRHTGSRMATDASGEAVALARANVAALGVVVQVAEADATRLDLPDRSIDRVVTDLPFGKRIGSHDDNRTLYPGILAELDRLLTPAGRAVLITDDKRLFTDAVRRRRGLKVVKEQPLRYNGVTPTAYTLTRVRHDKGQRGRPRG
ncbi:methyltransferase domain-containing protein [Calidifontibacter sp. DB0510]|uniref:Methyltransferase domain-containing protein n=1 Tax=Metallococcus carri TaxID=1656884 RepID=A0A967B079_9MICO|nr:methyltransferase domain-containing protein [Metallococcus carri]NHN55913.1 methyltransferase domain-containing protein [Metallococcus carri]NOP38399.1 methyltransferase domain-containing protein [Calidifontibacter sp. DB2511S]